jgi:hypothetical protein
LTLNYRSRSGRLSAGHLAALCNGCKVANATHEHCCHPSKQHGTDLEAGKTIHTAKTHEDRNGA